MKRLNKIMSILLIVTFLITYVSPVVSAANKQAKYRTKDEVVYGTLGANGASNAAYVVNVFEVTDPGTVTDYGSYESVKNLTNLLELNKAANHVQFPVEKGKFYYQGNLLDVELPWDFKVTYDLDGKKIAASDLLGKDGRVRIKIETSSNKEIDQVFFKHYTLQISVPFDVEKFSNIKAENATITNAGKMEQVTFTLLPEEEAEFEISAQVNDFELDGIDIIAIPFMMALDDFETDHMVEDMGSLSDAIAELHEGVSLLHDGVKDLRKGTVDLYEGSSKFRGGLNNLNDASGPLVKGSSQINTVLETIQRELQFIDELDVTLFYDIMSSLSDMETELDDIAIELDELATSYRELNTDLKEAVDKIPEQNNELELTAKEIDQIIDSGIPEEKVTYLMNNYRAAQAIKALFKNREIVKIFDKVEEVLQQSSSSLKEFNEILSEVNKEIQAASDELSELEQLANSIDGMQEFVSQYHSFHQGLVDYTQGVNELTIAYNELHGGIGELVSGSDDLSDGTDELNRGTNQLNEETARLPEEMQAEIDEFLKTYDHSDFEATSFISSKNKHIGIVQFILKTAEIKHPEKDEKEEKQEEKKGFWEMFKGLFGYVQNLYLK